MNLEQQRNTAKALCAASRISVLPYGNAWWLIGDGINQVVGEIAGITPAHLGRFSSTQR